MKPLNIPLEHAFVYNDRTKDIYRNKRDPDNPSKYTFQYPPEWVTANSGDRIIGFRSLWVSARARNLYIGIGLMIPDGEHWPDGTIANSEVGFSKILTLNCRVTEDWKTLNDAIQDALVMQLGSDYKGIIVSESTYLSREKSNPINQMEYQNHKYWSYYNQGSLTNGAPDTYGIRIRSEARLMPTLIFELYLLSDDTKAIFHGEDYIPDDIFNNDKHLTNCYEFYDVWSRKSCVIKSNIASGVQHNYLGHSHVRYDPLKYYRINNNDTTFSIELLISNNNLPVILPFDDQETITIEYVILQNATELYT
jgi:hypothetical protein